MCMEAGITTQISMFRDFCQWSRDMKHLEKFFDSLHENDWDDMLKRDEQGIIQYLSTVLLKQIFSDRMHKTID